MGNEQTLVLDASAVLAISFAETHGEWVAEAMNASTRMLMSAVTVTEVIMQLLNRLPTAADVFEERLQEAGVEIISVDTAQAFIAAKARRLFPLNLGDCFVYALAKHHGGTILTLDKDFKRCDVRVLSPHL